MMISTMILRKISVVTTLKKMLLKDYDDFFLACLKQSK